MQGRLSRAPKTPIFLVLPSATKAPQSQTQNKSWRDLGPLTCSQTPSSAPSPPVALMLLFLPPLCAPETDLLFFPKSTPPRAAESFIKGKEKNHDSAMVTLEPD